jgi:hypothetical protein
MHSSFGKSFVIGVSTVVIVAGALVGFTAFRSTSPPVSGQEKDVLGAYGRLPVSFEANQGQTDPRVRFLSRTSSYTTFLTDRGAVFSLPGARPGPEDAGPAAPGAVLRMQLVGADPGPQIEGGDRLPGTVSYFTGPDSGEWRSGIPTFQAVRYRHVYPGIDLLFKGTGERMEYDFVLSPRADPGRLALRFRGAESLRIDGSGNLVLETAAGPLIHGAPTIYQAVDGARREVSGRYRLDGNMIGFEVGQYDRSLPLVIDPLVYSTFLGGSGSDNGLAIALDGSGRAYVAGQTTSVDFPTTGGAHDVDYNGGSFDLFVARLSADGKSLNYATYVGGHLEDGTFGTDLAVDGSGRAHVVSRTTSETFPTTSGAYDQSFNGLYDVFLIRLSSTGTALEYSTYLGGNGFDEGFGVALDASGAAYLTGAADEGFPTTPLAYDTSFGQNPLDYLDAFVAKLSLLGAGPADLVYSTYLGSLEFDRGHGIAVDAAGRAYVTGSGAEGFPTTVGAYDPDGAGSASFVARLSADGSNLEYSTRLEGAGAEDLALDGANRVYVAGTALAGLPTTEGAFDTSYNGDPANDSDGDAFAARFSLNGAGAADLQYSTYLGGEDPDLAFGVATDGSRAFITGVTRSRDFPTTRGAVDTSYNGQADAFVARLSSTGAALEYSTFLGGSGIDQGEGIAVDGEHAYVAGQADAGFPVTGGAYDRTNNGGRDAFVAKIRASLVDHDVGVSRFATKNRITLSSRDGSGPYDVTIKLKNFGDVTEDIGYAVTDSEGEADLSDPDCAGLVPGVAPGATVTVDGCQVSYPAGDGDPDPVLTLTAIHDDTDLGTDSKPQNDSKSIEIILKP